jgi:diguanylate cyclase (GGDEF)-like protein
VASTIRDAKGEVAKLVIVNRDITERKRAEEQLEHNLFHDPLTGLPNRRSLLERLQQAFLQAQRDPRRGYALLLANVDHFKVFNETLGTVAGDRVLQEIGRAMEAALREADADSQADSDAPPLLSRLGSDEFAILLPAATDPSDAMRIARKIQAAVARPFFIEGNEARVSASFGIALCMPSHEKPEDLLKDADVAMQRAKALGGSRCEVFDEAMHSRAEGRLRLESDLSRGLGSSAISHTLPARRPVEDTRRREPRGFAALGAPHPGTHLPVSLPRSGGRLRRAGRNWTLANP